MHCRRRRSRPSQPCGTRRWRAFRNRRPQPRPEATAMLRRLTAPALTTVVAAVCAFGVAAQEKSPIEATLFDVTGQPGNVVRLEVSCTCEGSRATATVFGRDVPLLRDGSRWRGLIGIDLNVTAGKYPIALSVESDGTPALVMTRDLVVGNRQSPARRRTVAPARLDRATHEVQ